jgi:diguanylate cyclase (GGDEF)-like protein
VDIRTLFLAQTCLLAVTAAMLWAARSDADRGNGLRAWTLSITFEGVAYLVLAYLAGSAPLFAATTGNCAGAVSVALAFVAVRQFARRPYGRRWPVAMVLAVTLVGALNSRVAAAAIFNGFVYGAIEFLNARSLWRAAPGARQDAAARSAARVQRIVAAFYVAMGLLLPVRALALLVAGTSFERLELPPAWNTSIYLFGFVYVVVTKLGFVLMCKMRAEGDVRQQALTDDLTTLPNRRALDAAMAQALAGAVRSGEPFAVVMADVDRFKAINDTFGHSAGDAVLRAFARRLLDTLRPQDRAFRHGGEEFCVLLPDTDASAARELALRLHAGIVLPATETMHALTASFGVAVWRPGDDGDALFGRADRAMYRAKEGGRDRVEVEVE